LNATEFGKLNVFAKRGERKKRRIRRGFWPLRTRAVQVKGNGEGIRGLAGCLYPLARIKKRRGKKGEGKSTIKQFV